MHSDSASSDLNSQSLRAGLSFPTPSRRNLALVLMGLYLAAHILLSALTGARGFPYSLMLSGLAYAPPLFLCVRRALRVRGILRLRWFLFVASLSAAALEMLTAGFSVLIPLKGEWRLLPASCMIVSFTLVVLLVATPALAAQRRAFRFFDAIVCIAACSFCDFVFFATHGLINQPFAWADYLLFLHLAAAVAAILATRLYYSPPELKLINFVVLFQSLDFLSAFFSDYLSPSIFHLNNASIFDFTSELPAFFLALALLSGRMLVVRPPRHENYFIRSSLPLFLAFSPFLLGIYIVRYHLVLGLFGILLGTACSFARNTFLFTGVLRAGDDLRQNLSRVSNLANRDVLTPAVNRRAFDQAFEDEYKAASPQSTLSLVLLDLDFFKTINDTFGHLHGDRCLCAIANILLDATSQTNALVCRFGGDEFVILLPATSAESANALAERILAAVRALTVFTPDSGPTPISVSIGVASSQLGRLAHPTDLFDEADRNLYAAKHGGRKCLRPAAP